MVVTGGDMSSYNATVRSRRSGKPFGIFVASVRELNGRIQMLRSNAVTCTGMEDKFDIDGNSLYDTYFRNTHSDEELEITIDNCEGYLTDMNRLLAGPLK